MDMFSCMFLWLDLELLNPDWTWFISRGTRQTWQQEKCAGGGGEGKQEGRVRMCECVRKQGPQEEPLRNSDRSALCPT